MVSRRGRGVCPMEQPARVVRCAHRVWDNAHTALKNLHEVTSYVDS